MTTTGSSAVMRACRLSIQPTSALGVLALGQAGDAWEPLFFHKLLAVQLLSRLHAQIHQLET